jgi:Cu(I)/Ag(I) efflux system membrane protein CusA/SilA
VIIAAAKSVGRPLFFALLVITVSFIPVFSLTAQEGRLFQAARVHENILDVFRRVLGVTLVPVLMTLLIRGKITPEAKNPVNRFLIWAYQPFVNFVLRYRGSRSSRAGHLALTIFPFKGSAANSCRR